MYVGRYVYLYASHTLSPSPPAKLFVGDRELQEPQSVPLLVLLISVERQREFFFFFDCFDAALRPLVTVPLAVKKKKRDMDGVKRY